MKRILFTAIFVFCFALIAAGQNDPKIITKANEFLSKGDIKGAIAVLDKGVEKKENLFEIYRMRSSLYGLIGNLQGEFDDLTKALGLKATEGELYQRRAQTRMFLNPDTSLILSDLNSAIANGYKIEKVYTMRAIFRRQIGDLEGALEDYQTAVGLNPESASSNTGLASIYEFKGENERAMSVLENFLSKYENSSKKLPVVKGEVVTQTFTLMVSSDDKKDEIAGSNGQIISDKEFGGSTPQDMQKYTEQLEQSKNTAFAFAQLASLYEKRGDYEKALETVEKSIKIDPSDLNPFAVRGKIKGSLKDYEGALADLNKVIKTASAFPNYYLDRGIILLLMSKDDEAQKDFNKYLMILSSPLSKEYLEKRVSEAKKMREQVNQ